MERKYSRKSLRGFGRVAAVTGLALVLAGCGFDVRFLEREPDGDLNLISFGVYGLGEQDKEKNLEIEENPYSQFNLRFQKKLEDYERQH